MTTGLLILTAGHTLLSILALLIGAFVVYGLVSRSLSHGSASWFIVTAAATTITGFFFPFHGVTPAIVVGVIAAVILVFAIVAHRKTIRTGGWQAVYAIGLVVSEYLLVFVAIAQAFTKIPALHALAPTLKEPPFGIAQVAALVAFLALGFVATRRSRLPLI